MDARHQELIDKLARLTVEVGANVQPDQVVALTVATGMEPLVLAITEASYRRGAKFVDPVVFDGQVKRLRLELAPEETLSYVPPWFGDRMRALGEARAARIAVAPAVDPGLLDGVDPVRAGKDQLPFLAEVFDVINDQTTNWVVIPYATPGWAQSVYEGSIGTRRSTVSGRSSATCCASTSPIRRARGGSASASWSARRRD